MKYNNVVKFPVTYTSVYQCLFFVLFSIVPFTLLYTIGTSLDFWSIAIRALPSFLILYVGISNGFKKSIIIRGDKIMFYNGPFRYKLDRGKIKICYEKVSVLGGHYKDHFGLVLYRDKEKIIGLSMNNKFVLVYEMDELKFEHFQKEFNAKLGIEIDIIKPFW